MGSRSSRHVGSSRAIGTRRPDLWFHLRGQAVLHSRWGIDFPIVARAPIDAHDLVPGIAGKITRGAGGQGPIAVVGDGAVPGRGVGCWGREQSDGDLVLAGRLVDREAEVVGEVLLYRGGEGLAVMT